MATSWLLREPLKATAAVNISQGRLGLAAGNREAREHFQYVCKRAKLSWGGFAAAMLMISMYLFSNCEPHSPRGPLREVSAF